MDVVKLALTRTLPAYLSTLPLPDEFAGFASLTPNEWATLAPFVVTLLTILYLTTYLLAPAPRPKIPARHAPFRDAALRAICCVLQRTSEGADPCLAPESLTPLCGSLRKVNLTIKQNEPKVVDMCFVVRAVRGFERWAPFLYGALRSSHSATLALQEDIEDSGKKVLCRCWKSEKFPYCGARAQRIPFALFLRTDLGLDLHVLVRQVGDGVRRAPRHAAGGGAGGGDQVRGGQALQERDDAGQRARVGDALLVGGLGGNEADSKAGLLLKVVAAGGREWREGQQA